jgi:hypothetical protein
MDRFWDGAREWNGFLFDISGAAAAPSNALVKPVT